jgi:hypothetical protein
MIMSQLPTNQEALLLAQVVKRAELERKNKQAAKEQLLRIQLMLAKKTK